MYANKLNFIVIDQDEQHIALAQKKGYIALLMMPVKTRY
ncbi:hypothetical protein BMETH_102_5 [methanotrophic bacterial endosymbiont of Bathymodiolus sp.]|nr:hypothetical protein BMETH_102_5 [methanotrophic bacterial endosymbiont of Bathymodiolus sp.]